MRVPSSPGGAGAQGGLGVLAQSLHRRLPLPVGRALLVLSTHDLSHCHPAQRGRPCYGSPLHRREADRRLVRRLTHGSTGLGPVWDSRFLTVKSLPMASL